MFTNVLFVQLSSEQFSNFARCLSSTAEENWQTMTEMMTEEEQTPELFRACFQRFLLKYCTSDARDVMIDYLRSHSCKKPHNADVRAHSERIRALCALTNSLPGTMPELNEAMRKKILFDTFPEGWQLEFTKARNYGDSTEQEVIDYMCIEKTSADNREKKRGFPGRGGGPPMQRGRFGGRGNGRGFNNGGRGFGGRFNNGRGNFFNNNNNGFQRPFNNFSNGSGYGNNNSNGGRFQNNGGRFNNNYNRGRGPSGRAPMG